MKDLSRQKFEENWKQAFDGAQAEPSASVWSNVELDLVRVESDSMKKQVLFYKWLAAASVFLVVFLGGTFYYASNSEDKQLLISSTELAKESDLKNEKLSSEVNKNGQNGTGIESGVAKSDNTDNTIVKKETERNQKSIEPDETVNLAVADRNETTLSTSESKQISQMKSPSRLEDELLSLLNSIEEVPAVVRGEIKLPRLVLPAMPAAFMASSKKSKSSEDLWASVGISAGSYNPGNFSGTPTFSSSSAVADAYLNSSGYSDQSNVGSAYSAGFAMSKRVFSRFVLQSGVNYVNQSIGYTSNYLAYSPNNQSKAFVSEYADFASQSVTITSPYQINSAIEVVSVPLQTGYLLIDRKIGWQLNTGVAADFFIRNTLTDQSGNVGRFSQPTGENSPYRAVSWAGLLGTELSYKVAKQYRISVVPSMRYSVNSVLKSTTGQASNPLVMDIGFRFRYIFK